MKIYKEETLGKGEQGWLKSNFHFSFADYFNHNRMGFGKLRVINDDLIQPGTGFGKHPHQDMEIISYIVSGEITHKDSMGSSETLYPGEIQYISAGTGIFHSEFNEGQDVLRLLQIWILPDKKNHKPVYGSRRVPMENRKDLWLHLISKREGEGLVKINQDANIFSTVMSRGKEMDFLLDKGRQLYGIVIDGVVESNGYILKSGDGFDSSESLTFRANKESLILIVEMMEENHE